MKSFVKFVISIFVICIILGTVYFFFETKAPDINKSPNEQVNIKNNGSINNDSANNDDGENVKTAIEIRRELDGYIKKQDDINKIETISDNIGIDILGEDIKDYVEFFGVDTVFANINKKGQSVEISPAPDFINNQVFYYQNGKLVLYKSVSNTIGGQVKYYFYDGKLLLTEVECDVEDSDAYINMKSESEEDILNRAKKVYEKYIK